MKKQISYTITFSWIAEKQQAKAIICFKLPENISENLLVYLKNQGFKHYPDVSSIIDKTLLIKEVFGELGQIRSRALNVIAQTVNIIINFKENPQLPGKIEKTLDF